MHHDLQGVKRHAEYVEAAQEPLRLISWSRRDFGRRNGAVRFIKKHQIVERTPDVNTDNEHRLVSLVWQNWGVRFDALSRPQTERRSQPPLDLHFMPLIIAQCPLPSLVVQYRHVGNRSRF